MFNWASLFFDEILELYGGNVFMAELDYEAQGLSHADWAVLISKAHSDKLLSPTVAMLMIERASVK
jgi:hypothetical protein